MRPWRWILLSVPLAIAALPLASTPAEAFDSVLVSGPRRGAFFSCACGADRRGGMTLAYARAKGRVLWVEVGDAFGNDPESVRQFLRERPASTRVEGEAEPVERIRFASGREALLVFVDRLDPKSLAALPSRGLPLLCVGAAFDPKVYAALRDAPGAYLVGDRPRRGSARLVVVGFEGLEGRQVAVVGDDLAPRVHDVVREPGTPADPMDVRYLEERHASAGLRVRTEGLLERIGAEDPSRCEGCHPRTVARWRASRHAHALEHLDADAPRTCFGCHAALRDRPPRNDPALAVSCAVCHGDLAAHPAGGERVGAADCAACHTEISSPRFERASYWARIRCGEEEG
jgi:hypothetical protein